MLAFHTSTVKKLALVSAALFALITQLKADTLILTKLRPWHSPDQIYSAIVVKTLEDRVGYLVGHDAKGKEVQLPKSLVIAVFNIPEPQIPKNLLSEHDCEPLRTAIQTMQRLEKLSQAVKKQLSPYLVNFQKQIQPELDKFDSGNVKDDGVWISTKDYNAQLLAAEEREKTRLAFKERERVNQQEKIAEASRKAQLALEAKAAHEREEQEKQESFVKIQSKKDAELEILKFWGNFAFWTLLISGLFVLFLIYLIKRPINEGTPNPAKTSTSLLLGMCTFGLLIILGRCASQSSAPTHQQQEQACQKMKKEQEDRDFKALYNAAKAIDDGRRP